MCVHSIPSQQKTASPKRPTYLDASTIRTVGSLGGFELLESAPLACVPRQIVGPVLLRASKIGFLFTRLSYSH